MSKEWNDFYQGPSMMDRSGGDGSKMYQYIQGVHLNQNQHSQSQSTNGVKPVASIHEVLNWSNESLRACNQGHQKTKQFTSKRN